MHKYEAATVETKGVFSDRVRSPPPEALRMSTITSLSNGEVARPGTGHARPRKERLERLIRSHERPLTAGNYG